MNLAKTIKVLQKDVQSYNVDNERLRRAKAQQDEFNAKLMKSVDKIEKKMDKEINLSRSRSHRSHDDKRREERSVNKHYFRKDHNSLSPSLIRRCKRRTGVNELQGEMNKIKPPTFDGEHKKDEDVETWLLGMRKYFQLHNYPT
jgi:hypothetical protein